MTSNVAESAEVSLAPSEAFDSFVDELGSALERRGLKLDAKKAIKEEGVTVGKIETWIPGEKISFAWTPKSWESDLQNQLVVSFEATKTGTRVKLESHDWGHVLGDEKGELLGWFAGELASQLISSSAPNRLGDWITDRHARSPSGARSREVYRKPVYHYPNFLAILDHLYLGPEDFLLDVGCGGGAFLHEALKSGCHAAGLDHSADMVRVASESNEDAIEQHRLELTKSEADTLPYSSSNFTCVVTTGVLTFLPNPARTFREVYRVLRIGGRFVVFTSTKELKGTPAAPEPVASRLHFYEDGELEKLATDASFSSVRVEHPDLFEYAKKSGVPEVDLPLFSGTGGSQLMIARK
jgi:ubiquinone/menaquinone biosynthesis C-methylase UbiE